MSTIWMGAFAGALSAQNIDIGLYPTAVPDSFEVRLVSPGSFYTYWFNMAFTLRWESSAGGTLDASDVAPGCADFEPVNYDGVVVDGDHRYATFLLLDNTLGGDCAVNSTPRVVAGIRIRDLAGCYHLAIVNDAYTSQNNANYWTSCMGIDRTGHILTGPIAAGSCPHCDPPQITTVSPDTLVAGFCPTGPVDLSATATGPAVEYHWYGPDHYDPWSSAPWNLVMVGYEQNLLLTDGAFGTYTVVAINDCGTDTAYAVVTQDVNCVPPEIVSITHAPLTCLGTSVTFDAVVENAGVCPHFFWVTPGYNLEIFSSPPTASITVVNQGLYTLSVTNACGSDTLSGLVEVDTTGCVPPEIVSITHSTFGCDGIPLIVTAEVNDSSACLHYLWTMPEGSEGSNPVLITQEEEAGLYRLIVSNPCGSDTASVLIDVDTAVCEPPQIVSISQEGPVCTEDPLILTAFVNDGGECAHYQWTGPVLIPQNSNQVFVANAPAGTYQLVLTNPCGSDSLSVPVLGDTVGCVTPEILQITSSPPEIGCFSTIVLNANVSVGGPCPQYTQYTWNGPQSVADGSTLVTVPNASPGTYELIAASACGSDTLSILVPGDSLGAVMPDIENITSNSPVCEGEALLINATVNDPNAEFNWTAVTFSEGDYISTELPYEGPSFTLPEAPSGYHYILHMTNACGSDDATIVTYVIAAEAQEVHICPDSPQPYDLSNGLNFHIGDGTWTFNGTPHSGFFDMVNDNPGTYYYQDASGLGCPDVPVVVSLLPTQNNGTDTSIFVCTNGAPINLFGYLGGTPDPGGTWGYNMDSELPDGIFDPLDPWMGDEETFRYEAPCGPFPPAYLTVIQVDTMTMYADLDVDGLGDPDMSAFGCALSGYVVDNTDLCPQIFGTTGSPCDDGLPGTVNDTLDNTCTCVGELSTFVVQESTATSGFLIWPNPGNGASWTITADDPDGSTSQAMFEIHDVLGNLVLRRAINANGGSIRATIAPEPALASGIYMAELHAGKTRSVQRLVVK